MICVCFAFFYCDNGTETNHDDNADHGITPKESFQKIIPNLMSKWYIPGGAVALVKNERLVLAEGYGQADKENNHYVVQGSLFRIASISKPITAVAVLKLYEDGLLDLDEKAFVILDDLQPPKGAIIDLRIYNITVRDLLQHSGGWDREKSFDPMFMPRKIAEAMGVESPPDAETIIRYMLGQPLDFTPGTRYAYSNFGYCVLGRIIERVTKQKYEDFVKTSILEQMGITRMRVGHSLLEDRAKGEVRCYDYPGASLVLSVFPDVEDSVPYPYGGFYLEAMDSHGGWIASVVDLMRFVTAVDNNINHAGFLKSTTIELMVSRPDLPDWKNSDWYYGLGWQVRPQWDEANWWHTGSLPGTVGIIVRSYHGLAWAALFNSRPSDHLAFMTELDSSLWRAVNNITVWPSEDLFDDYPCRSTDNINGNFLKIREYERFEVEKRINNEMPMLLSEIKIHPNLVNGELKGFKITKIPMNSILCELEIHKGDIIKKINDIKLDDFEDLFLLYNQLMTENRFEVLLERKGCLIRLLYILR